MPAEHIGRSALIIGLLAVSTMLTSCQADKTTPSVTQAPTPTVTEPSSEPTSAPTIKKWSEIEPLVLCKMVTDEFVDVENKPSIEVSKFNLANILQDTLMPDCVYDLNHGIEDVPFLMNHFAIYLGDNSTPETDVLGALNSNNFIPLSSSGGNLVMLENQVMPGSVRIENFDGAALLKRFSSDYDLTGLKLLLVTSRYDEHWTPEQNQGTDTDG